MQLSRLPPTLLPSLPPQRSPRRMKEGDERVVGKEERAVEGKRGLGFKTARNLGKYR